PIERDEKTRREAISSDRSFLIEAAAGTGKTTLLVQRVLNGVRSGQFRLKHAAAITFTEKAAAEMEFRLRARLIEELAKEDLTDRGHHRLHLAVEEIDQARISTIHSFCANLLRARPVEAGIDPNFAVLDETRARILRERCWEEWISEQNQNPGGVFAQALAAGVRAGGVGNYGTGLKDLGLALLKSSEILEQNRFELPRPELSPKKLYREFQDAVAPGADYISAHMKSGNKNSRKIRRAVRDLSSGAEINRFQLIGAASDLADTDLQGALKSFAKDSRDAGQTVLGTLVDAARKIIGYFACDLFEWLSGFAEYYREEKKQRSVADFHDLLLLSARMLRENIPARKLFQKRFDAILVDEFQDTDPLQAEIIAYLCEDSTTDPAQSLDEVQLDPIKLFVVGDPKQSIYRFRRADVQVYEKFKSLFGNLSDKTGRIQNLFRNFRSTAMLIDSLNDLFEPLFAPAEEDGVYQAEYVPLVASEKPSEHEANPIICLYPPPGLARKDWSAEDGRRCEARHIAHFIREVVEKSSVGSCPLYPDEGKADFGDFALLFRALTDVGIYEEALEEIDIPYRVVGGKSFYRREEIVETISVLRALDDPLDSVSIIAALRSSYFGISDEDLFRYYQSTDTWNYTETTGSEACVTEPMRLLGQWHEQRNSIPPQALLRKILDTTKAVESFQLKPGGEQRAANIEKLSGQMRMLWNASHTTFRSVVDYLADLQEREEAEEESSLVEPGEPFVHLMSIHKSKGLQFPIVCLPDLSRRLSSSQPPLIVDHVRGRVGLQAGAGIRSINYNNLAEIESKNELAEQKRVLYVAATRAERSLVLPLFWQKNDKVGDCLLGFLLQSGGFPDADEVPFGESRKNLFFWDTPSLNVPKTAPSPPVAETTTGPKPSPSELLEQRDEWIKQRDVSTAAASKGIRIVLPSSLEGPGPAAFEPEEDRSGGRFLGSLFHRILERIPLRNEAVKNNLPSLIRNIARAEGADMQLDQEIIQRAAELARNALQYDDFLQLVKKADRVEKEVPFAIPLKNLPVLDPDAGLLEGTMDLVCVCGSGTTILDFKTDLVPEHKMKSIASRYWPQLWLYGLAAKGCGWPDETITLALYFVRESTILRRILNPEMTEELAQVVNQTLKK
ncbi:MAG: UvrD-helicase domain-containing protein, partial [Planctomycetes bacterium]|nr:UvrD-helicase domain-containing protein [Planctomycetota bacterium]